MMNKTDSSDFGKCRAWMTVKDTATVFGKSVNWIHIRLVPLLQPRHVRKERSSQNRLVLMVHLPAAIEAWVAHEVQHVAKAEFSDPLMTGGESPALERYRLGRAEMVEMDLEERRENLIDRAAMHHRCTSFANHLRGAGEQLQREHGQAAYDILEEAIDDYENEVFQVFATDGEAKTRSTEETGRAVDRDGGVVAARNSPIGAGTGEAKGEGTGPAVGPRQGNLVPFAGVQVPPTG